MIKEEWKDIPGYEGLYQASSFGYSAALNDIEKFLDTLSEEHNMKDVRACIKEYYGEYLSSDDERTKAAYHFFSAGCSFELRQIEEEEKQHIVDLLDNYKKGRAAGYNEAIQALKDGKIESSPVMKEFLTKLLGSGFGFSPNLLSSQDIESK